MNKFKLIPYMNAGIHNYFTNLSYQVQDFRVSLDQGVRKCMRQERDVLRIFGDEYRYYMRKTPMFIPARKNTDKKRMVDYEI